MYLRSSRIKNRHVFGINYGFYEGGETKAISKYVEGDLPVIDLGASIGWTSSYIVNKIKPPLILSIEADKELLEICKINVRQNTVKSELLFDNLLVGLF